MIDTAHFHAYRAADDVDQAAARGVYPDMLTRARVRADTGYAVEKITQAIDKLLFAHGSAGFAEASPLQRIGATPPSLRAMPCVAAGRLRALRQGAARCEERRDAAHLSAVAF